MGLGAAVVDATPFGLLTGVAAFAAATAGESIPPALVGPLAGMAVLTGAIGISLSFQTENRRLPLLTAAADLVVFR